MYQIIEPIGKKDDSSALYITDGENDEIFISNGAYVDFTDLWLNGELLERDIEYTVAPGSTVINVKSQTIKNHCIPNQTNTIVAEFHKGGDHSQPMKKAAQNFMFRPQESQSNPIVPSSPSTPSISNGPSSPSSPYVHSSTVTTPVSLPTKSESDTEPETKQEPDKEQETNLDPKQESDQIGSSDADEIAARSVVNQINGIPSNISLSDKSDIEAARANYNSLSADEKGLVTNLARLEKAESLMAELEKRNKVVERVVKAIRGLSSVSKKKKPSRVNNVMDSYYALSLSQQEQISQDDKDKLYNLKSSDFILGI